jgi:hypothetical protein
MRLCRFIFLLLILLPLVVRAQMEQSIWYFGDGAGIDFSGGFPAVISGGAIRSFEGCASIADRKTGRLLFYTNGDSVWNAFGRLMPNGTGLYGHWSSTQSALIVPVPGDANKYYIFTADAGSYVNPAGRGVNFSVVDMQADGGRGDVVQKNFRQLIVRASEKLVAVRMDNGQGYWVITSSSRDNGYYAFRVTGCGVSYQPVISNAGSFPDPPPQSIEIGYMKASPDGRWLAAATSATNVVQLFDFDIVTGRITFVAALPVTTPYGLSFSPNSRKLYAASADMTRPGIYQYDMTAGSPAAIVASAVKVPGGGEYDRPRIAIGPRWKDLCRGAATCLDDRRHAETWGHRQPRRRHVALPLSSRRRRSPRWPLPPRPPQHDRQRHLAGDGLAPGDDLSRRHHYPQRHRR